LAVRGAWIPLSIGERRDDGQRGRRKTELACEAEMAFEGSGVISPDLVQRLGELTAALRENLSA
jgi:hypothetical protein